MFYLLPLRGVYPWKKKISKKSFYKYLNTNLIASYMPSVNFKGNSKLIPFLLVFPEEDVSLLSIYLLKY